MTLEESTLLQALLLNQPVASLGTLHNGQPAVSMVPFALRPDGKTFIIHVSQLATHTRDMLKHAGVGLLVNGNPADVETPLALPRISIQGQAYPLTADSSEYAEAKAAYLAKLPDAETLFSFADFSLFAIHPEAVRFVAGFGRAMAVQPAEMAQVVKSQAV